MLPIDVDAGIDRPPDCRFLHVAVGDIVGDRHYRLDGLWQLHCYDYRGDCWLEGRHCALRPGSVTLIPPGWTSRYRFTGPFRYLVAHFALAPSDDQARLPTFVPTHRMADRIADDLAAAIAASQRRPARAVALMWAILWRLADALPSGDRMVNRACERIEAGLANDLSLPALAATCACSVNTLIRRFRTELGVTPATYVRQRRAERARHMLGNLQMAPRDVARELGFDDLQRFNKAIRAATGFSPRQLRSGD